MIHWNFTKHIAQPWWDIDQDTFNNDDIDIEIVILLLFGQIATTLTSSVPSKKFFPSRTQRGLHGAKGCLIAPPLKTTSLHYGLSPIEKGDIKNFKFKALLHIQLWSKNVQTFFKWCQTPKSWLLILVFIIYVKYLRSYLQKTWRGGLTNLKFCVLANQLVPKKRVENNIFVRGPLHGANIGQIFSSPFSSENMFWNICSHF